MARRISARQRIASRRNLVSARRHKGVRSEDTLGHYFKAGIKIAANSGTFNTAGKANTFISGNYRKKPNKFYKKGN